MSEPPSITELRDLASHMSEGPWSIEKPQRDSEGWSLGSVVAVTAPRQAVYSPATRGTAPEADRRGIAALRNAAPALLEIAAALLAYEEASCDRESAETDDYIEAANRGECAGDTHDSRCPVAIAHDALIRTAAKVRR